ncbi:MAG: rlmN, partial [Devosia sp.]|nr:rlmN [Devosia sp.]
MSIALNLDHSSAIRPASLSRPSLIGLSKPMLAEALQGVGIAEKESRMRASQLWNWLYVNGVTDFDKMTNVAKPVRQLLADSFILDRPEIVSEQVSSDGTRKWLFRFRDPANPNYPPVEVETVY